MKRYFEFAERTSVLLTTLVMVVLILFFVFPILPINGELLDEKTSYSYEEAIHALEAYGVDGRPVYLWVSLLLDTLFPIAYATFFAGLIYRFRVTEGTWWLAYVPIFGGAWDLMENIQISSMLVMYPNVTEMQVAWASGFTQVKHWIGSVYLVIAVVVFLVSLTRATFVRIRSRERNS